MGAKVGQTRLNSIPVCNVLTVIGVLLCIRPLFASSIIPDEYREAWFALLHYRTADGRWFSDVQDPSFFFDPNGPSQPELEWDANRRAFLADSPCSNRHAQCRFPARFFLMKEALGWTESDVTTLICSGFEDFRRRLRVDSLSVVFVSHYLGNPVSAFGHSMLYFGSLEERSAVLASYSVSFEANIDGMASLQYIPNGIAGGLVAEYRVSPLYERVRKYERQELRDLWLFPLRVSREELDQLVRHLWELQGVPFQYGFFRENCAQKLLALVHAVAPDYELLPLHSAVVLPSDVVVRLVERVGLDGEPTYRPSLSARYSHLVRGLNSQERRDLEEILSNRTVVYHASTATLSAALLWSEINTPSRVFRRAAESEDHPDLHWQREVWSVLAENGEAQNLVFDGFGESLLDAHGPSRIKLSGVCRQSGDLAIELGMRWLLHEALDPPVGYPPFATLELLNISIEMDLKTGPVLNELTALRIERLAPATRLQSALAWKTEVGARRLLFDSDSILHLGVEAGIGIGTSIDYGNRSAAVYTMVGIRPGINISSDHNLLLVGIWSSGLLMELPASIRASVATEGLLSLLAFDGFPLVVNTTLRMGLAQNWDIEMSGRFGSEHASGTFGIVMFQ